MLGVWLGLLRFDANLSAQPGLWDQGANLAFEANLSARIHRALTRRLLTGASVELAV